MMRYFITCLIVLIITLIIAVFGKYGLGNEIPSPSPFVISCTCKAESIIDLFPQQEERNKAIDWFKAHGVSRVYLETFRHGRFADEELLQTVRHDFKAAGLEVYGAICPTTANVTPLLACPFQKEQHEILRKVVQRTAKNFDRIILDDFLFSACSCTHCTQLKGKQSWADFRCDTQLKLGKKFILDPAKEVNTKVQFYIKYPCWYGNYRNGGYDVIRDTQLYGMSWIGTETREPDDPAGGRLPQTQASWIQGWANDFSNGLCGGAWFDPLGTKPDTYVEQARQSILGGAREILIHSYDYLGTNTPGIAAFGNGKVDYGKADAEAFRQEKDSLLFLANELISMEPYGILLAKHPNSDVPHDAKLNGFLPLLGFPVLASASLKDTPSDIFTLTSAHFPDLHKRLLANRKNGHPTLISMNLIRNLPLDIRSSLGINEEWLKREKTKIFLETVNDSFFALGTGNDHWDLMSLPENQLNDIRDKMTAPLKLKFHAPTRVSLHLFQSPQKGLQAIENFNNVSVHATLTWLADQPTPNLVRAFPNAKSVRVIKRQNNSIQLELAPRSLAVLEN